jgi:2-dehydro-3-deoxygluconokinase
VELVKRSGHANTGRVVLAGEGMLEFSGNSAGNLRQGYGGDTLNVAIHLTRLGVQAAYFSALGNDPLSTQLRRAWQLEGVDTRLVLSDPERRPGLYLIRTDDAGERTFFFWRSDSAARRMLSLPTSEAALAEVESADLFFYSLITLAILSPEGRDRLFEACHRIRANGGRVAFDGNYRPQLWASPAEAHAARERALTECDYGLPTLEDEHMLGETGDAQAIATHWMKLGVGEVVVKLGAAGCLADGEIVPPPRQIVAVDTSGAGDAFDAAYLAARLRGTSTREASLAGHRLAAWVVQRPGAIPARDADAPY